VSGPYQGREVQQHLMNSFFTDPSLGLTFVLHRVINEPEWTDFPFFERNWIPILLYVVLAWLVCPLLFWWGINMSNRFQFNFTVDLDGEDVDTLDAVMGDRRHSNGPSSLPVSPLPDVPAVMAEQEKSRSTSSQGNKEVSSETEHPNDRSVEVPSDTPKKTRIDYLDSPSVGPLTRRLMEDGPVRDLARSNEAGDPASTPVPNQTEHKMDLMSSSQSDVEKVRQNNIRKSSQSYNRHESSDSEKEKDVDYLAGVQSDVLKSLIQKLRDE
jgi:hypothetical protein